jgi:hypothetical protein
MEKNKMCIKYKMSQRMNKNQNVNVTIPSNMIEKSKAEPEPVKQVEQLSDPIFNIVKDIAFNMIINIPGLRAKLDSILKQPNLAIEEISKVFMEVKNKISEGEMNKLRNYISKDSSRTNLTGILQTAFVDIMSDGKIDMNDANHFLTLIYNIITLFNESAQENNNDITITGEAIMFFLYFIIKSVLILTLDGQEEKTAVGLLESSFKLVSISLMPLTAMKCSCNPFACFKKK